MKYSSVLSGVFHERVIICESDADCMFYSSVLDLPDVNGSHQPDVLFVHANGKHRMASLARTLTSLDVPTDVIADIDVLREEAVLKQIIEVLGGDWSTIQPLARSVRHAVEQYKATLTAEDVRKSIEGELEKVKPTKEFPKDVQSKIENIFRETSPWSAIKRAGEAALPQGQATQQFNELKGICSQAGLWIVPVGELEGFCKSIGGHGPSWVQRVLEDRDLSQDDELESARVFMCKVWKGNVE